MFYKLEDFQNNPNWKLSLGEKLGKTHFRNGHDQEYIFYEAVAQAKEYVKSDDALKAVSIQLTDFLKRNTIPK